MGRATRQIPARMPAKLRQIREELGLSQNEMIRLLNVKEPLQAASISGFESGEREPSLLVLLRYARVGNVCLDSLVDDEMDLESDD